jgi:hypothetical protein
MGEGQMSIVGDAAGARAAGGPGAGQPNRPPSQSPHLQPGRVDGGDEELGAVGVGARVGHRQHVGLKLRQGWGVGARRGGWGLGVRKGRQWREGPVRQAAIRRAPLFLPPARPPSSPPSRRPHLVLKVLVCGAGGGAEGRLERGERRAGACPPYWLPALSGSLGGPAAVAERRPQAHQPEPPAHPLSSRPSTQPPPTREAAAVDGEAPAAVAALKVAALAPGFRVMPGGEAGVTQVPSAGAVGAAQPERDLLNSNTPPTPRGAHMKLGMMRWKTEPL